MKHMKFVVSLADNLNYSRVGYYFIVFALTSTPCIYLILNLLESAVIRGQWLSHRKRN